MGVEKNYCEYCNTFIEDDEWVVDFGGHLSCPYCCAPEEFNAIDYAKDLEASAMLDVKKNKITNCQNITKSLDDLATFLGCLCSSGDTDYKKIMMKSWTQHQWREWLKKEKEN